MNFMWMELPLFRVTRAPTMDLVCSPAEVEAAGGTASKMFVFRQRPVSQTAAAAALNLPKCHDRRWQRCSLARARDGDSAERGNVKKPSAPRKSSAPQQSFLYWRYEMRPNQEKEGMYAPTFKSLYRFV